MRQDDETREKMSGGGIPAWVKSKAVTPDYGCMSSLANEAS